MLLASPSATTDTNVEGTSALWPDDGLSNCNAYIGVCHKYQWHVFKGSYVTTQTRGHMLPHKPMLTNHS